MIRGEAGASAEDSSCRAWKVPRSLGFVLGGTGEPWEGLKHGNETIDRFACGRAPSGRSMEDALQEGDSGSNPGKGHKV